MQILQHLVEMLSEYKRIKKLIDSEKAREQFDAICKMKWANYWQVKNYKKLYEDSRKQNKTR